MNLEAVTLQDCLDMHKLKGKETIINDGKVMGFKEKSPHRPQIQVGINSRIRLLLCLF